MREGAGLIQGIQKIYLGGFIGCAHGHFNGRLSGELLGLYVQNANALRQNFLQSHEHARPVKAAGIDDIVNEIGVIVKLGVFWLSEKTIQLLALGTEIIKNFGGIFALNAKGGVRVANLVDVPS